MTCRQCHAEVPLGSGFCPRCGSAIDDGLGRRQQRIRVIVALIVGLLAVGLVVGFFSSRVSRMPASAEIRQP